MLVAPPGTTFRRVSDEYPTVSRFDAELLGCALFWGADRRLTPTERRGYCVNSLSFGKGPCILKPHEQFRTCSEWRAAAREGYSA